MDAQAEEERNDDGVTWEEWATEARIHPFLRASNERRIKLAKMAWTNGVAPAAWLDVQNHKYRTRWFNLGVLMPYVDFRPMEPGENRGWGDRLHIEIHHHPEGYTAGFNNPSFGIKIELKGWRLSLGAEY